MVIRERYSDQVHSGEILDVLSLNGTPACLLDLRLQTVTLNQQMQGTLQLQESDMSFSQWIRSFGHTGQQRLQQVLHNLLTDGNRESSVQLTDINKYKYQCKMVHLTNGQIAFSLKSIKGLNDGPVPMTLSSNKQKEAPLSLNQSVGYQHHRNMIHMFGTESSPMKNRMMHLVDKFPHGLALINHNWEVTYANPKMEEMTEVPFLQNYFKKLWDIFPIREHYHFFQQYLRSMETQETVEFEGYLKKTNTDVQVTVHPTEMGITVFLQDITEYKNQLKALRASEERFALLANNIKDVFWISQPDFKELHYVSPAFQEMFGISRREAFLDPNSLMEKVHESDRASLRTALDEMAKKESEVEYRLSGPKEESKWIRTKGFPVEYYGNSYVLGIHEDVTEYK